MFDHGCVKRLNVKYYVESWEPLLTRPCLPEWYLTGLVGRHKKWLKWLVAGTRNVYHWPSPWTLSSLLLPSKYFFRVALLLFYFMVTEWKTLILINYEVLNTALTVQPLKEFPSVLYLHLISICKRHSSIIWFRFWALTLINNPSSIINNTPLRTVYYESKYVL